MTVTYTSAFVKSGVFGLFQAVFQFRGSIYTAMYSEVLLYITLYYFIFIINYYYIIENPVWDKKFKKVVEYAKFYKSHVPVSFALGFYLSLCMKRWWEQYMYIPMIENMAISVNLFIRGSDDRSRLMRRTIIRYMNVAFIIVMRITSPMMKRRFPKYKHLVQAGLLMVHEHKIIEILNTQTNHPKYWVPLVWSTNVASKAKQEGRIGDEFGYYNLMRNIAQYRGALGDLLSYDWLTIPLCYTQIVTVAVYSYFASGLFAFQYYSTNDINDVPALPHPGEKPPKFLMLYCPILDFVWTFLIMGLLKVAEILVNPFGMDDDDFEVSWFADRNFHVGLIIADNMYTESMHVYKDKWWGNEDPTLPYPYFFPKQLIRHFPFPEFTEEFKNAPLPPLVMSRKERLLLQKKSTLARLSDPVYGRVVEKSAFEPKSGKLRVIEVDKIEDRIQAMERREFAKYDEEEDVELGASWQDRPPVESDGEQADNEDDESEDEVGESDENADEGEGGEVEQEEEEDSDELPGENHEWEDQDVDDDEESANSPEEKGSSSEDEEEEVEAFEFPSDTEVIQEDYTIVDLDGKIKVVTGDPEGQLPDIDFEHIGAPEEWPKYYMNAGGPIFQDSTINHQSHQVLPWSLETEVPHKYDGPGPFHLVNPHESDEAEQEREGSNAQ